MDIECIICKAETSEAYKKMRNYIYRNKKQLSYQYEATFVVSTNPKAKIIQIRGNRKVGMELLEYFIRKYLQAHPNNGWDRTVIVKDT